jgi:hypothetical protein
MCVWMSGRIAMCWTEDTLVRVGVSEFVCLRKWSEGVSRECVKEGTI